MFEMHVKDERDRLIADGLEQVKCDAFPTTVWNPESVEAVCKAAIQCMSLFSDERFEHHESPG
jgi:hypothetical protein